MHDLYKEECEKQNINAKKSAYYRYIFNNNFNINFHLSQKRTDLIAVKKLKKKKQQQKIPITIEELAGHDKHFKHKIGMRAKKISDKSNDSNITLMVVSDTEI